MFAQSVEIGTFTLDELLNEMELVFTDEDRERKLLTTYENIRQTGDVYSYVTKFKSLLFELGGNIPDNFAINRFITGLKYEIKKHVLTNTNVTTLTDAILSAERAQATFDFLKSDNPHYFQKNKRFGKQNQRNRDESVPMELGHSKKLHNIQRNGGNSKGY